MAPMKANVVLAFLATWLLLFLSAADQDINPFCDTADDKILCSQMAQYATSWPEAMTNLLLSARDRAVAANKVPDYIVMQLPISMKPITKDSIDKTCREAYENIFYNIDSCLEFIKDDPYGSLRSYLSATSFVTCTDTLSESQIPASEADQFGDEMLKLGGILLAVAEKKPYVNMGLANNSTQIA